MKYFFKKYQFVCLLIICSYSWGWAQTADSLKSQVLEPVVILSTRLSSLPEDLPVTVTLQQPKSIETTQQLSLKEQLFSTAGVYSQNAYNFAQDLRISIRGFGSRSSFGINGIKILVDGVPETTPDGQGQLDNLNLGQITQLEVIKSTSSAIYGNASGGVIHITTQQDIEKSFLELNSAFGSYNFNSHALSAGLATAQTKVLGLAKYLYYGGYRNHSQLRQFNGSLKVNHKFTERANINLFAEFMDSPIAQDAGGLTLDEANADYRAARQANLDYNAGEAVRQMKTGASFSYDFNSGAELNSYFFYSRREFDGRLPFSFGGIIDLKRNYFGHGSAYEQKWGANTIKIGYDALFQNDNRQRFENLLGEQGQLTFHQEEIFNNLGIYLLDQIKFGRIRLNAGIRYDINKIVANDLNQQSGDNSKIINLPNLSPSLGLGYLFTNGMFVYSNYSFGFKTPTLNQLSNRPDGAEGFNDLKPQLANNFELGIKTNSESFLVEMALFYIETQDDLIPYELPQFPNRTFYRNVGETNRLGTETLISLFLKNLTVTGSYTFSKFEYSNVVIDSTDLSGKLLPGIPSHFANLNFAYEWQGFEANFNLNYSGSLFADDQNLTSVASYVLANLRTSYLMQFDAFSVKPYFGINNLFNTQYFDNIRINGFGQRYYEPAPEVNFYLGVNLRLSK